jgi:hypothetical protein
MGCSMSAASPLRFGASLLNLGDGVLDLLVFSFRFLTKFIASADFWKNGINLLLVNGGMNR